MGEFETGGVSGWNGSTNNHPALKDTPRNTGLSAGTLSRLKEKWGIEYDAWRQRDTFATVRLRTAKTRGCVSRDTILGLTFKLGQSAAKRGRRLRGYQWLEKLHQGVTFIDGIE